ncbi:MAG TPA: hypothetical protein VII92_20390 [Anaerolineae bacterium]
MAAPIHQDWYFHERSQTGLMIVARSGALLFRFDPQTNTIFSWDKHAKREVSIRLEDLTNWANQ